MVDKDEIKTEELTQGQVTESAQTDEGGYEGRFEDMDSMQDLYDQSFQNIQEGEVIRGRIVQVNETLSW